MSKVPLRQQLQHNSKTKVDVEQRQAALNLLLTARLFLLSAYINASHRFHFFKVNFNAC
jgi:hypothetical protein